MGIISLIANAFKAIGLALGLIKSKEDRDAGAEAQREVTDAATTKTLEGVSAPVSTAERDQLWDSNKAKFGPAGVDRRK